MTDDPYIEVELTVIELRDRSVRVETDDGTTAFVPRSVLHGADDSRLARGEVGPGDVATLRIRQWCAVEKGLAR
jgi:hypothetical protein